MTTLAADDVSVTFPGTEAPAVDGVHLSVSRGETLGLVGESGSGKSTVARVLVGLVRPSAGHVRLAGQDLLRTRDGRRQLRRQVQMVFQDATTSLNPRLTAARQIAEALTVAKGLRGRALDERVGELLDLVALPHELAGRYPHELSGGQCQRVAIARALAIDAQFLIADEVTASLDASVQAGILNLLRDLQQRFGLGCLFISHDLAVVRYMCHRVAVMHRGQIVERGATDTVLSTPQQEYTRQLIASLPRLTRAGLADAGEPGVR